MKCHTFKKFNLYNEKYCYEVAENYKEKGRRETLEGLTF